MSLPLNRNTQSVHNLHVCLKIYIFFDECNGPSEIYIYIFLYFLIISSQTLKVDVIGYLLIKYLCFRKRSYIRGTLNLLTWANRRTNSKTHVTQYMSHVTCHISHVTCHMSPVTNTNFLSHTPLLTP